MNSTQTNFEHTDTHVAMHAALQTLATMVTQLPNCEETALNEANETLRILSQHVVGIGWLTDRLTQTVIDYTINKEG